LGNVAANRLGLLYGVTADTVCEDQPRTNLNYLPGSTLTICQEAP
jgi:hypothetical protein